MFETHGLNHITLFVRDLEVSLKFYTDILRMGVVRGIGKTVIEEMEWNKRV